MVYRCLGNIRSRWSETDTKPAELIDNLRINVRPPPLAKTNFQLTIQILGYLKQGLYQIPSGRLVMALRCPSIYKYVMLQVRFDHFVEKLWYTLARF